MKDLLREELERMLYLNNHKRGVVLSEQKINETNGDLTGARKPEKEGLLKRLFGRKKETSVPDWNQTNSGKLDFSAYDSQAYKGTNIILATNVRYKYCDTKDYCEDDSVYNVHFAGVSGKNLPKIIDIPTISSTPPNETPPTHIDVIFTGSNFPYPDNMIDPKFDDYLTAYGLFKICLESLSGNITTYGIQSIKEIRLKGTADSAPPTRKAPKKYGKLDHKYVGCSDPDGYCGCGRKDLQCMNLYLAKNRAIRMAAVLTQEIKKLTGVDISSKIVYDEPVSYYDKNYGNTLPRRGVKSVGIEVLPVDQQDKSGTITPGQEKRGKVTIVDYPKPKKGYIEIDGNKIDVFELITQNGTSLYCAQRDSTLDSLISSKKIADFSEIGKMNGEAQVEASIKGDEFIVNGISWGNFKTHPQRDRDFTLQWTTNQKTGIRKFIGEYAVLSPYIFNLQEMRKGDPTGTGM